VDSAYTFDCIRKQPRTFLDLLLQTGTAVLGYCAFGPNADGAMLFDFWNYDTNTPGI
jgi:hypothetical protein